MTNNNRDEQGRYESEHGIAPADVFNAMEPIEPYTTAELAATVGAPRRTVLNYLDELAAQGRVRKKKPGQRQAIWIREP